MDVAKGVLVEVGRVPELAINYNQGKVQILYTYIGLSLNPAISIIKCYQVFCMYIEANGRCGIEYRSREAGCYCVLLVVICCSMRIGRIYCLHTHSYSRSYTHLPCSTVG